MEPVATPVVTGGAPIAEPSAIFGAVAEPSTVFGSGTPVMSHPVDALAAAVADPWAAEADLQARDRETHVVVRLGGGRYAIELGQVSEVLPLPAVTRLPSAPLWMHGVSNWRGRVLPVLDLRPMVGAERRPPPSSARMVVVRDGDIEAGLLVEAVHGLIVCDGALADVPPTVPPAAASILSGTVESAGPVAVVDVVSVLALRGQLAQTRPAW